jgi:hypothetical protein
MDLGEWNDWWKHFGISPVKHVLLLYWDPIGVYGVKYAHDEYDGYVGGIGSRLREGARAEDLAAYLTDVAVDRMGITPTGSREAATRLEAWFNDAMQRLGEDPLQPVTITTDETRA